MPGYTGLTLDMCVEARRLIWPAVEEGQHGTFKRRQGCLVVLDPTKPWEPKYQLDTDPDSPFMREVVLFQHDVGVSEQWPWDFPYDDYALRKAFAAWKYQRSTLELQQIAPHLLGPGVPKWAGGIYRDGLPVAFSGDWGFFDELIAEWMWAACVALCRRGVVHPESGILHDDNVIIIGGEVAADAPSTRLETAIGATAVEAEIRAPSTVHIPPSMPPR